MNTRHFLRRAISTAAAISVARMHAAFAQDPLQAELRVLTQNVFGKDDAYCDQRAAAFGHVVAGATPAYDLVGLTEYYSIPDFDQFTCDSEHLLNAIRCSGRYTAGSNSRLFYPEAELFPLREVDGGLGLFTMGTICDFEEMEFSHAPPGNEPYPLQGTILCRVNIPGTTVTVDVYVTHIHSTFADGCNWCCKQQELVELGNFIAQHSRRSGNPVILMGDFNIGGPPTCCGPKGYADIMALLGHPRDLWLEENACTTHTCDTVPGDCDDSITPNCSRVECPASFPTPEMMACTATGGCGAVTCVEAAPLPSNCNPGTPIWRGGSGYTWDPCVNDLNDSSDLERIDFIFLLESSLLTSSAFRVELVPQTAKIANFTAIIDPPGSEEPFLGHISDHLGVEATIRITGRSAIWVDNQASGPEDGGSCDPFNTVAEAVAVVPAGDRVLIRSGSYPPPLIVTRPLTLHAIGGTASIGR